MTVIDEFLEKIEPSKRKQLERIRRIAKQTVPKAEEVISYGMPSLKYQGEAFLGFNTHKNHIGIYPFGSREIILLKNELTKHKYEFSSGAIRVTYDKPMPEALLKKIIKLRIKRIEIKK